MDSFNGKSVFYDNQWESSDALELYSDAAGSLGFASVFGSEWFAQAWPIYLQCHQTAVQELFPIVLALEVWGDRLQNKNVLFFSDNMAVVHIINKQSCKDKTLIVLVRRLVLIALKHNIWFKSKHIPGKINVIADSLSRLQFQKAHTEAPWLRTNPVELPQSLLVI